MKKKSDNSLIFRGDCAVKHKVLVIKHAPSLCFPAWMDVFNPERSLLRLEVNHLRNSAFFTLISHFRSFKTSFSFPFSRPNSFSGGGGWADSGNGYFLIIPCFLGR